MFGDIILPRLNENCIVVGFAVIASQSLANLIPSAGAVGMLPLAASASEALENGRKKKMLSA